MRFFNRISLQTPESVELDFTLAGIGNRAYALLIDYICLGMMLIFLLIAWVFLSIQIVDILEKWIDNDGVFLWLLAIQLLIMFFTYTGYFVFFEVLWQGQTPGKRFVKIRVVSDDGKPIKIQQATLRALLRAIDDFFFIGVFFIVFGKREKRIGDWLAGTMVIQEEHSIGEANFPISEEAKAIATQLQKEAEIARLLPEDFAVIRDYLQRRQEMLPQAKIELSKKLAYQVKTIIALEKVPPQVTPTLFLEAIYIAYQQPRKN